MNTPVRGCWPLQIHPRSGPKQPDPSDRRRLTVLVDRKRVAPHRTPQPLQIHPRSGPKKPDPSVPVTPTFTFSGGVNYRRVIVDNDNETSVFAAVRIAFR